MVATKVQHDRCFRSLTAEAIWEIGLLIHDRNLSFAPI